MAITQDSMNEEILNQSERAMVRAVYKATRINEALLALEKLPGIDVYNSTVSTVKLSVDTKEQVSSIKAYLLTRMQIALMSVKVPIAKVPANKDA